MKLRVTIVNIFLFSVVMKILVKGFGDLKSAITESLKSQFNVIDLAVVNASQAYAVTTLQGPKNSIITKGAAFHLDLEDSSLYLIGGDEESLSKSDIKRLNMMPSELLAKLDNDTGNPEWRKQTRKYLKEHESHLFRGAIMHSFNPPEVYDHGALPTFIVTHPASKSGFDLDGNSVEVPQYLRGFYHVHSVPTLDRNHMREGVNSIVSATKIMLTNLSVQQRDKELTARYLNLSPTPPILVISDAKTLVPIAMSKESITFEAINNWGLSHNKQLGIDKDFLIDNSDNVKFFINEDKAQAVKDNLKSKDKLNDYRTPAH